MIFTWFPSKNKYRNQVWCKRDTSCLADKGSKLQLTTCTLKLALLKISLEILLRSQVMFRMLAGLFWFWSTVSNKMNFKQFKTLQFLTCTYGLWQIWILSVIWILNSEPVYTNTVGGVGHCSQIYFLLRIKLFEQLLCFPFPFLDFTFVVPLNNTKLYWII